MAEIREDLRLEEGDDLLLSTLITSARLVVEAQTGCRLITQAWDLLLDKWPVKDQGCLTLPHYPVTSLAGIFLLGKVRKVVDAGIYDVELGIRTPKVFLKNGMSWPTPIRQKLGILVSMQVGFGDAPEDVPEPLRLAIRQLVGFWYEQGDWHAIRHPHTLPESVNALMQPFKVIKL